MRNHDALRTSGRAGGVDEISEALWLLCDFWIVFALERDLIPVLIKIEVERRSPVILRADVSV